VLNQEWDFALKIINKASEQDIEDKLYARWIVENHQLEKPVDFTTYMQKLTGKTKDVDKVKRIDHDNLRERIRKFRKVVDVKKGGLHV
jgi:hypothetical protein